MNDGWVRSVCMACIAGGVAMNALAADTGKAAIVAHAACDGSFFAALKADAARWKGEKSFRQRGRLASFAVANRKPPEPFGGPATLEFARPRIIDGLPLAGWFDADLSAWSRFARFEIGFLSWGFYVAASPADTRDWLQRNVPTFRQRMQPTSAPDKAGIYCVQQSLENGQWQDRPCSADEDFPTDPKPMRWLVVRPDGPDGDRSVISCEVAGKLSTELLRQLRPDL